MVNNIWSLCLPGFLRRRLDFIGPQVQREVQEQREAGRIRGEGNGVCARLASSLHGALVRAMLSTQVPGWQAGSLAGVCLTQRNCGYMKTGDGGRGASPCAVMGSGAEDTEAIHLLVGLEAGIFSEKGE